MLEMEIVCSWQYMEESDNQEKNLSTDQQQMKLPYILWNYQLSTIIFQMSEQSQIVDLSNLANFQILQAVEKLLEESDFSKFTLVLTRKPKQNQLCLTNLNADKRLKTKYSTNFCSKCTSEYSYRFSIRHSSRVDNSQDYDDNYHIGLRLYHQGEFENALQLFLEEENSFSNMKEGVEKVKQYQDLCFHIGNCYYRTKDYEKAIEYFSRKFEGEELKQQGQKFNNLGSCYAHLDQPRLSLSYYTEAFKVYSQFSEIDCSNLLNNLGTLYAQSGMYETGQKYFNQSIEERKTKSPDSNYLLYCSYLQLGNCQKELKKLDKAIVSLKQALKLSQRGFGDQSETLTQLAGIYQMSEKWNEALHCYELLSAESPRKGFLFQKAALLHRNMGHYADYDRFIKQAFEQYTKQKNERKLSELHSVINRPKKY